MNFELTQEQQLLKDSVTRFVVREYGFERRSQIVAGDRAQSARVWSQLAALGLLALPFSECDGGLGGGAIEMMLVGEALGHALVVEPWLASVVLAGSVLRDAASPAQRVMWMPGLMDGTLRASLAHFEAASRYDTATIATRAVPHTDGFVISGDKSSVLHASTADLLLVSARTADGISLFAVPRAAAGLSLDEHIGHDGQPAADLHLHEVVVSAGALVGPLHGALPLIERAVERGLATLCAFALGTMTMLYEQTLEHVRTRRQFGTTIGSFQAVQHRMAEMLMQLEHARSMLLLASERAESGDAALRARTLSAAKAVIGQCARFVGQQAVQLHGGMGMTDELIVSHGFKALTMFELQLGDTDHHLARVSDAIAAEELTA